MNKRSKKEIVSITDLTAYKLNNLSVIHGGTGGVLNMAIGKDSTTTTSDDEDGDC